MEEVQMPTYLYKAMTKNGQIVKNKITDVNKMNCLRRLKRSDLLPISVVQTFRVAKKVKKGPRNFRRVDNELKKIGKQILKGKTYH